LKAIIVLLSPWYFYLIYQLTIVEWKTKQSALPIPIRNPTCLNRYFVLTGESKIVNLEEELRMVGENLKALEVAEEKAQQREEEYKKQMRIITERLKIAESR